MMTYAKSVQRGRYKPTTIPLSFHSEFAEFLKLSFKDNKELKLKLSSI